MQELTKAEEQIMQILWKLGKAFVKDIVEEFPEPKPAYNTVSTIVRILEDKQFVGHQAFGKTHEYYPLVGKKLYSKSFLKKFTKNYFSGSYQRMVSFLSEEEELSVEEMQDMMNEMERIIEHKKAKTKHYE
jgi:predicted transcriptional regulator